MDNFADVSEFSVTFTHPHSVIRVAGVLTTDNDIVVTGLDCGTRARLNRVPDICASDERVRRLVKKLFRLLDGIPEEFSEVKVGKTVQTPFTSAVTVAMRTLPFGVTCSYSELAEKAGFPKAVRAAASVVRANRVPLIIPCHRIIRKDGSTGGFCGAQSGPDVELKKKLLRQEKLAV